MRIVSFSFTTPAFLAGEKTVTRRRWKGRHAAQFTRGLRVQAWDKSPHFGGKKIGVIELKLVEKQTIITMPDSDYEAEGFGYLHRNAITPPRGSGFLDFSMAEFNRWRRSGEVLWVVRFKIVEAGLIDA